MDGPASDPKEPAFWGAILLFTLCVSIGGFDLYAILSQGRVATVSSVIRSWAAEYPIIGVSMGVIIGHLFFPSR